MNTPKHPIGKKLEDIGPGMKKMGLFWVWNVDGKRCTEKIGLWASFFQNKGSENWAFKSEYPHCFFKGAEEIGF